MRATVDWFRLHPWIATSFFAGALLGVILCLPLVPFELPDSHASLIGAALGAFVAVWGAAWVADGKNSRTQAASRGFIALELFIFQAALRPQLRATYVAWEAGDGTRLQEEILKLGAIADAHRVLPQKLLSMQPLFSNLGPPGVLAYFEITDAVNAIFKLLSDLSGEVITYVDTHEKFPPQLSRIDASLVSI